MAERVAESCAPLSVAGYENEFVDSIPDTLSCPVCLLPFRDPHLVSCCGAKFCEPCIGRVKAAGQPCPLCKQEFGTMLDRGDQRKVLNLKVRCSRHNDGCQWVGELRYTVPHETEECEWAVVECSYQCGAHLPRRLMEEHEHDLCPRRPMDVKLETFMKKMEERHQREKKEMDSKMAEQKKDMQSKMAEQKKEMQSKMAEQKKEMQSKMAEQKKEMQSKMAEQKKEMQSKMAEQKKEMQSKMAEQKKDMQSKMAEQKKEMQSKMANQKKEMERNMSEQKKETLSKMAEHKKETRKIESKMTEQDMVIQEMETKITRQNKEIFTVRDNQEKMKEEYTIKNSVMKESLISVTTVTDVEEVIPLLRGILISSHHVPIELIMTQYTTHKKNKDQWYSPPFYTGPGGYKMGLRVDANGCGDGTNTHVSVFVYLMKGEYDSRLVWPFRGDITIQLVNHKNDPQYHCERTVPFNDAAITYGASNRVTSRREKNDNKGWGYPDFVTTKTCRLRHIIDDCLKFRITKIVYTSSV